MSRSCMMPQGHPTRCGCEQRQPSFIPTWNGISVIQNAHLPHGTMMVSPDIFEMLKRQGEPR